MFAILALITFALALFGAKIGSLNLLYLGLVFLSAALIWNPLPAWSWGRRTP